MKQMFKRGFTLIELLVVIAIIGILASVVLASLNTARDKGADAAAKSSVNNMRAQAELVYDSVSPSSYEGVCENAQVINAVNAAANAQNASANFTDATAASASNVTCHDSATAFAVQTPLNGSGVSYCVDSTGAAKETSTFLATNDYAC